MDENKEVNSTDPKREKVRVIPLSAIDDAPDHPFGVRDDDEMAELVESISTFGVNLVSRSIISHRYRSVFVFINVRCLPSHMKNALCVNGQNIIFDLNSDCKESICTNNMYFS